MTPKLDPDGAELFPGLLPLHEMELFASLGDRIPAGTAGQRLLGDPDVCELTGPGSAMTRLARELLGPNAKPVRAILFDKSATMNWPLGWHQDRTICVKARAEVPGYGPFTIKHGLVHVSPPAALLSRMITLRAHLDPCSEENAPLKVALGSHAMGLVPEACVAEEISRHNVLTCTAQPGDVWVYASLILHASDKAEVPARRRVLHVDYSAEALPPPLEWAGV